MNNRKWTPQYRRVSSARWGLPLVLPFLLIACADSDSTTTDTTAPTVSSTTPVDSATGVAQGSNLTVAFGEDMLGTSIGESSFTLAKSSTTNISGSVSFNGESNVASFDPSSSLTANTAYTATLSTAITDLSGNALAANYTWSFTTAAVTRWGTAALIESENTGNASSPQIAFDTSGNAIAVWHQSDGTRTNIWANRFNGTSWGTAELIEADDVGNALDSQVAIDSSGNAIAVWRQRDATHYTIWTNRFDGTNWGTAELIETNNPTRDAVSPQIAVDNNGNAIAVWHQASGNRHYIWANYFNGTSWGTEELIETNNGGDAQAPQIAFDNNGNAIAVWQKYDGTRYNIWTNRFNGASWGTAAMIEVNNDGHAVASQVAFDNSGKAIAVWHQTNGTRYNVWANHFDGTSWGTAVMIETNNDGDAQFPQIAVDNSGNAMVVWYQSDGTRHNTWANRFDGTNWGTAELIETDNVGNTRAPQIAVDNSGNAIAVWYQSDGTRNNIWANRFDGTSWGTAELIETDNAGTALSSQVAFDNSGNAIAVWSQTDGTFYNIWANRFE